MGNDITKSHAPELLPADLQNLRMPAGTPLGLGILGAARFSAIRRVLEYAAQAQLAKANYIAAVDAAEQAFVNREATREKLQNLDTIRQAVADQIIDSAYTARLRRRLEQMELEDQIAEKEARRARARGNAKPDEKIGGVAKDEFADFMEGLRRMPAVAQAAAQVKAEILKNAGGEEKMDEGARQMVETIDAMMSAFVAKQAEGKMG